MGLSLMNMLGVFQLYISHIQHDIENFSFYFAGWCSWVGSQRNTASNNSSIVASRVRRRGNFFIEPFPRNG
jgi:hypothetical protein